MGEQDLKPAGTRFVLHPELDLIAIDIVPPRDHVVDHIGVPVHDGRLRERMVLVAHDAPVGLPVVAVAPASGQTDGHGREGCYQNQFLHLFFSLRFYYMLDFFRIRPGWANLSEQANYHQLLVFACNFSFRPLDYRYERAQIHRGGKPILRGDGAYKPDEGGNASHCLTDVQKLLIHLLSPCIYIMRQEKPDFRLSRSKNKEA